MDTLPFAIILMAAPTNQMEHLRPLVPDILRVLGSARPGMVHVIGG